MTIARMSCAFTVRGQRLFIRPLDPQDLDAVRDFLGRHGHVAGMPKSGAIGKLVGELVAVAKTSESGDAIRLDDLFVAPELRKKRIGRFMVDELVNIARTMNRQRLIVEEPGDAAEFFRKVGFVQQGPQWERRV
jgi:GNAT superfamily N-acetyltransferase